MDRRRFTPRAEGLDERVMMTSGLTGNHVLVSVPTGNLKDKTLRIDRLANLLDSNAPNRVVPESLVTPLQLDLVAITGRLSNPASPVLNEVNRQYRSTITHASITKNDVAGLNATFADVMTAANAPLEETSNFQRDLTELLKYDSHSSTPAILAANDYSTVLQIALAVGRPIHTPTAPTLLPTDSYLGKGGHTTTLTQPTLEGSYDAGTTINLLDETGAIIGTTTVPVSGPYTVKPSAPLSVGTHFVRVQATDVNNDHSLASPEYKLIIRTPPVKKTPAKAPSGPLSL